ncbi:MAG TPA: serine/threonine protein phosphatase [Planctomycetaceae bacterium]|nr:serine/threonine protein phosphatase [Planctomycetaceae bacterium]
MHIFRLLALLIVLLGQYCFPVTAIAADRLTPAPSGTFAIVLIPDTQAYKGANTKAEPDSAEVVTNPIFEGHVDWIANHIEDQNIVFVSHVGDIVDKNVHEQWAVARKCMDALHGKVPYGISVGNHDMTSSGDSTLFREYFPATRFERFPWYGGSFAGSKADPKISGSNSNSFQLFTAGGIEFLFLHLECNAPDDVLEWANEVLRRHVDRPAFITSHMGWGPKEKPTTNEGFVAAEKGRMTWSKIHGARGNTPQQLWEKCYRLHPNLIAVFSGDQSRTQAFKAESRGNHGNVVHELLQDYGSGWLRLYRFTPQLNRFEGEAITVHSKTGELCQGTNLVPDRTEHQFRLKFDLVKAK